MLFPVACFTREGVKFWSKVEIKETCWVWHGAKTNGYGAARRAGTTVNAHRVAWESLMGPIPEGYHLDHLCRNTSCVNPAHLEPVTPQENHRRGLINQYKGRLACSRGHLYVEGSYRWRNKGGRWSRVCRECRRERSAREKQDRRALRTAA